MQRLCLSLIMDEQSFGIIPIRYRQEQCEVLLVRHTAGHWSFPKGHAENDEKPFQAACRELLEETGLQVKTLCQEKPLLETYFFSRQGQRVRKSVTYYVAEVTGKVVVQQAELQDAQWVPLETAMRQITFASDKKLCEQVRALLKY